MKKCDCYIEQKTVYNWPYNYTPVIVSKCDGTRERDECSCGGDRTKCDFYPEVRAKALKEQEPKFGEWISVKDRLPNTKGKYLIFTTICFIPDHIGYEDHYDGIEVSGFSPNLGFTSENGLYAKFWMPLPAPPTK